MIMQSTTTYLANILQKCIENKALKPGKLLHAHILRLGHFSDTFLSNRLIEFYSKCGHTNTASHLFDKMPRRNIYSYDTMLSVYYKENQLENAHNLFISMPERTSVSWNMMISLFSQNGHERKALELYSDMNSKGFEPTRFTFASVLSSCSGVRDVWFGKECHSKAVKVGLSTNIYVGNALLGMYVKCGFVEDAFKAFTDLPEQNVVSFTSMMGGLLESDEVEEAIYMFKLMHRNGIMIDSVLLSRVLCICAKERNGDFVIKCVNDGVLWNVQGKIVHGMTIKLGFENDLHLCNSLLDMYSKIGDMESAEMVFSSLSKVNTISWNVMIGGYGRKYDYEKEMEYIQRMQRCGAKPNEITFINMLATFIKCGDVSTARKIINSITSPSLNLCNSMLSGYSQNEYHTDAILYFREMQFRKIQFDRTTLAIVLSSCAGITHLIGGKEVHAASLKALFHRDVYIVSALIGLYSKCSKINEAKRVFEEVPHLDIACWNSWISGLSFNSFEKEAFAYFKQMLARDIFPNEFSYATVLSSSSCLFQGKEIHCRIIKSGYLNDVIVGSALINMYCKSGEIDSARNFFDIMICKNTVTWNEMIHGYAQSGCGDEAICLYKDMLLFNVKPDAITFVAVLTACSHSGLVDFGVKIFNSMQNEHGVEPILDHYTSLIDALGRAGRFNELEEVIDKSLFKDNSIIWEVLLSSCRVHGNLSLARRAANELFRLDPNNSTPYVLLGNMYSSLGRWDEAKKVREMMSERHVFKDPGYSWIDHSRDTFVFDNCVIGRSNNELGVASNG